MVKKEVGAAWIFYHYYYVALLRQRANENINPSVVAEVVGKKALDFAGNFT